MDFKLQKLLQKRNWSQNGEAVGGRKGARKRNSGGVVPALVSNVESPLSFRTLSERYGLYCIREYAMLRGVPPIGYKDLFGGVYLIVVILTPPKQFFVSSRTKVDRKSNG